MDRTTRKVPDEVAAITSQAKRTYAEAVRDWVVRGSASIHAFRPEAAIAHLSLPDETVARAHAHFRLGQHLLRRARPPPRGLSSTRRAGSTRTRGTSGADGAGRRPRAGGRPGVLGARRCARPPPVLRAGGHGGHAGLTAATLPDPSHSRQARRRPPAVGPRFVAGFGLSGTDSDSLTLGGSPPYRELRTLRFPPSAESESRASWKRRASATSWAF